MTQQPPSSDPNNDEQTQPPARRGGFLGWLLAFSIVAIVFSIANQPSGGVEIKSWETFLAYVEGNNQQVTVPSSDTEAPSLPVMNRTLDGRGSGCTQIWCQSPPPTPTKGPKR